MLSKLFGSNARVKILKLLLLHPERRYGLRQISRDLKLRPDSARRELDNLEKVGIVILDSADSTDSTSSRQASPLHEDGDWHYRANTGFVLHEEIKTLIIKAQILYEKDFVLKLRKIGKPKLLIFTGFFVNANFPVDILIVGKFNKIKLLKLIKELERELAREVNFTLMDSAEFKYRRDITDVFLYDILEGKKITAIDEVGVS